MLLLPQRIHRKRPAAPERETTRGNWADAPEYPKRYAGLAFRLGVNYVLYTMTH